MKMITVDPGDLVPNPWNSNRLTPEAEKKLRTSIERHGLFKPVVARRLADGRLQILGGQHRAEAAEFIGVKTPVIDLGEVDDVRAKEIGIIDNGRYGHDDADALAKLLDELGDASELATFMPFDLAEIDAMNAVTRIDLDSLDLGLDDEDAEPIAPIPKAPRTHVTMRMRVAVENQGMVEDLIKSVIHDQGFDDSDATINAGEVLVWLARRYQSGIV